MAHVTKDRKGDLLWCGRTWVAFKDCVWLRCFRAHDCGDMNSQGRWVRDGRCVTNYFSGCPPDPVTMACCENPSFKMRKTQYRKRCRNCHTLVPNDVIEELTVSE